MHIVPNFFSWTILLLGLRHGIDWDHIAAITDITSSTSDHRRAFLLSTAYALSHGFVIVILGVLAVAVGVRLPASIDFIMEKIVGISLLFLSIYLFVTIIQSGKDIRLQSRWMLIFDISHRLYHKFTHHMKENIHPKEYDINLKTACTIGIIHAIGAETPTQLFLFTTAAGVEGRPLGLAIVFIFVCGILISNSLISHFSVLGIKIIKEYKLI